VDGSAPTATDFEKKTPIPCSAKKRETSAFFEPIFICSWAACSIDSIWRFSTASFPRRQFEAEATHVARIASVQANKRQQLRQLPRPPRWILLPYSLDQYLTDWMTIQVSGRLRSSVSSAC
jgi:hypothetical protein